jgi:SAM-dependent methyltransferase
MPSGRRLAETALGCLPWNLQPGPPIPDDLHHFKHRSTSSDGDESPRSLSPALLASMRRGMCHRRNTVHESGPVACAKVQTVKASAKETSSRGETETRRRLPGLTVKHGLTKHPFDLKFGVKTSGLVAGRHLTTGHRHDRHATAYFGVAPSVFKALIRRWRISEPAARMSETTFIDLGAGMGRAVLLASELQFREVVGVELHPLLAGIARRNMRAWRAEGRARAPMRMVQGDAVAFQLPEGPALVFLFNPFGPTVLNRLLKAWRKAAAGRPLIVDLLYVNNEQEHVLESARGWTRVYLGKVPRSRQDAIADHKIMANQPEGEYASSNWEDCSIWRSTG